jgi:hypothetical protein
MCYSRARQLQGALPLPGPAAPERRVGWERGSPPAQAGGGCSRAPRQSPRASSGPATRCRCGRRDGYGSTSTSPSYAGPSRRRPARTPPSTSPTRPSRSWTSPKRNAVKSTAHRAWSPPAPCCASDAIANRGGAQTPPLRSSGAERGDRPPGLLHAPVIACPSAALVSSDGRGTDDHAVVHRGSTNPAGGSGADRPGFRPTGHLGRTPA